MLNQDKLFHLLAGALVVLLAVLVGHGRLGLPACILAGIGKELWDRNRPNHTADWNDAISTFVGGLLAVALLGMFHA